MTIHIPVLPKEVLEGMNPQPGDVVVDGTLGGGGHTIELLKRIGPEGRLLGFDRDPAAVEETGSRIQQDNATFIASNFRTFPSTCKSWRSNRFSRSCSTLASPAINLPIAIVDLVFKAMDHWTYGSIH